MRRLIRAIKDWWYGRDESPPLPSDDKLGVISVPRDLGQRYMQRIAKMGLPFGPVAKTRRGRMLFLCQPTEARTFYRRLASLGWQPNDEISIVYGHLADWRREGHLSGWVIPLAPESWLPADRHVVASMVNAAIELIHENRARAAYEHQPWAEAWAEHDAKHAKEIPRPTKPNFTLKIVDAHGVTGAADSLGWATKP